MCMILHMANPSTTSISFGQYTTTHTHTPTHTHTHTHTHKIVGDYCQGYKKKRHASGERELRIEVQPHTRTHKHTHTHTQARTLSISLFSTNLHTGQSICCASTPHPTV